MIIRKSNRERLCISSEAKKKQDESSPNSPICKYESFGTPMDKRE